MAGMTDKNYYEILEVEQSATTEEIRKAFQTKARKLHPDVNKEPDAEERFKEISEAYAVLSDDDKRKRYDAMRAGNPFASGYGSTTSTSGGYRPSSYGDPFGDSFAGWGWPFPDIGSWTSTTTRSRSYNPRPGADIDYEINLDDAAATTGTRQKFTYQRYVSCASCGGAGSVQAKEASVCPTCGGRGSISVDLSSLLGLGVFSTQCPECEGSGKVVVDPCSTCGGTGRVLSASEIEIDVPAGAHDGDELRNAGMGNAGTNGSEAGDFVTHVCIASERLTARQRMGFHTIGYILPFIVLGLILNTLSHMLWFIVISLGIGLFQALSEGIRFNKGWSRNALRAIASGVPSGLFLAFFVNGMYSCSSALVGHLILRG